MVTVKQLNDMEGKITTEYETKIKEMENSFKTKLKEIENSFNKQLKASIQEMEDKNTELTKQLEKTVADKLETMMAVVKTKDEEIGKLNREIAGLQHSMNFITQETTDLNTKIKDNTKDIKKTNEAVNTVESKASDLEDRSRRSNLVFFNIAEDKQENCFKKLNEILADVGIQQPDSTFHFDRAHRLGPYRQSANRPRPIIVKFTYYLDKEYVLRNAKKLATSPINVSEDFSRATMVMHKKLAGYGKKAKENKEIDNYQIRYRKISAKFTNGVSEQVSFKTYSLGFIEEHPLDWFRLKQ